MLFWELWRWSAGKKASSLRWWLAWHEAAWETVQCVLHGAFRSPGSGRLCQLLEKREHCPVLTQANQPFRLLLLGAQRIPCSQGGLGPRDAHGQGPGPGSELGSLSLSTTFGHN